MNRASLNRSVVDLIAAIANYLGVRMNAEQLKAKFLLSRPDVDMKTVRAICDEFALTCTWQKVSPAQIAEIAAYLPIIGVRGDGMPFLITSVSRPTVAETSIGTLEFDADRNLRQNVRSADELFVEWAGDCLVVKRLTRPTAASEAVSFGSMIVRVMTDYPLIARIAMVAALMSAFTITTPLFFQAITNKVLPYGAESTLEALVIIVVAILLLNATATYLRAYFISVLIGRLEIRLESFVFEKLLRLPIDFFESSTTGLIARRVQQVDVIKQFLASGLLPTGLDLIVLAFVVPVLFVLSTPLAIVVIGFATIVVLLIWLFSTIYRNDVDALLAVEGRRQAKLVEAIRGVPTIKALVAERDLTSAWSGLSVEAALCNRALSRKVAFANALIGLSERLTTITVLAVGVRFIIDGRLTLGSLVAVQMLTANVTAPMTRLVSMLSEYQKVRKSAELVQTIFEARPERNADESRLFVTLGGRIEFDRVTYSYDGVRAALNDVSFSVDSGKVIAIVGESGSGKTTVSRLLQGLAAPQRGAVRLDGVDLRDLNLAHHRSQLGVVLQDNFIFRATVAENIAYGLPHAPLEDVVEAARAANALPFIGDLPAGFQTLLEENGANLSGGQRQRIAIARALLRRPKILLLDEATSALDAETEAQIVLELRKLAAGRTVIMVTHRLATVVFADYVLVMAQGTVEAFGSRQHVLQSSPTFRNLVRDSDRVDLAS